MPAECRSNHETHSVKGIVFINRVAVIIEHISEWEIPARRGFCALISAYGYAIRRVVSLNYQ